MPLYVTEKIVCHNVSLQVCRYISLKKVVCHSTSLHEYVTICSTLYALPPFQGQKNWAKIKSNNWVFWIYTEIMTVVIPVLKVAVTNAQGFLIFEQLLCHKVDFRPLTLRPLCSFRFRSNKKFFGRSVTFRPKSVEKRQYHLNLP